MAVRAVTLEVENPIDVFNFCLWIHCHILYHLRTFLIIVLISLKMIHSSIEPYISECISVTNASSDRVIFTITAVSKLCIYHFYDKWKDIQSSIVLSNFNDLKYLKCSNRVLLN